MVKYPQFLVRDSTQAAPQQKLSSNRNRQHSWNKVLEKRIAAKEAKFLKQKEEALQTSLTGQTIAMRFWSTTWLFL